jgi:glycosyltransferase involved in cell wall biosynthesis
MRELLLVGNYAPDGQKSMGRYGDLLERELRAGGRLVVQLRPAARFIHFSAGNAVARKWLGYFDKYVVFPLCLRREVARRRRQGRAVLVHVCDHGNSLYTRWLRPVPHVVTCHDLLAVQCALGEVPGLKPKWTGRRYQAMILEGLRRAQHVVCVSEHTRRELLRLGGSTPTRSTVVPNGLNGDFRPTPRAALHLCLQRLGVTPPYLLHVGSNSWYKNRRGVLEAYALLVSRLSHLPGLVLAGTPLPPPLETLLRQRGLAARIRVIVDCRHEELCALYSGAEALLFPSLAEGFGWPIIEAQACGCRVVTGGRPPMTEVGGKAAVYAAPDDPVQVARAVETLLAETAREREARVESGLANAARFSAAAMVQGYSGVYDRLTQECL